MKLLKIQSTGDFINLDLMTHVETIVDGNGRYFLSIYFSNDDTLYVEYSSPSKELFDRLTNLCEVVI